MLYGYMWSSSMLPPRTQVSSDASRFFPVMIAFLDSIRNFFMIGYEILIKDSETIPTSRSFAALGFLFYFHHHEKEL